MLNNTVKTIAIGGTQTVDLIHYVCRILVHMGISCCVEDYSASSELRVTVPDLESKILYVDYRGVDFNFKPINKATNEYKSYDYIIKYVGTNKAAVNEFKNAEIQLVSMTMERHKLLEIKEFIGQIQRQSPRIIRVYRDVVDSKIDKKYLDELIGFSVDVSSNELEEVLNSRYYEYFIYLDDHDYKTRIALQYNDQFKFNKLSKELKNLIREILEVHLLLSPKAVSSAYKKAERGA